MTSISGPANTAVRPALRSTPSTPISASGWISSPIGPLSTRELKALRAATGDDFEWPPNAASGIPVAALAVAGKHADEMTAGIKLQEIKAHDIQALGVAGLVTADGVARGVAALQGDSSSSASAAANAAASFGSASSSLKPVSGTVTSDGSTYL